MAPMSTSSSATNLLVGPWPNYRYPAKWEFNDDFMGVHFQRRSNDDHIWSSQCTFWSEAIQLYAQQLLRECPYKHDRLTFTPHDVVVAHTRSNRMTPWCIPEILKFMKFEQSAIETEHDLDHRYRDLNALSPSSAPNGPNAVSSSNANGNGQGLNESLLDGAVSGVSSLFSSMVQYVMPSGSGSETDDESECDDYGPLTLNDDSKVLYVPLLEELCGKLSTLSFYSKSPPESELSELIEIGTIRFEAKPNEFIISGLVFTRFCTEVLRLTLCDVVVLKKWLIVQGQVRLFYLGDAVLSQFSESQMAQSFTTRIANEVLSGETMHELKDEMLYFNKTDGDSHHQMSISKEQMAKMQLLSIQMTMKRLSFQKSENESTLNQLNQQLMAKLQRVPAAKRKMVLQRHAVLLRKKKWLKQRIQNLDGSIFNLETTLNSMEDLTINKMVFEEMKNADKMLKTMLETVPSIEDIEEMKDGIQHSMDCNDDLGQVLAKPMDTDAIAVEDEEELLREYEQMEMETVNEELPSVPTHHIVVDEKEANDGDIEIDGGDQGDAVEKEQVNVQQENGKEKEMVLID